MAREVEVLRRCADWLQRLEHGENVVVNLRPDEDVDTEFVAFDWPRVVRVLERIAADPDTLSLVPNDPHADKESNHHDPRARHRYELAESPPKPKKLSHREQRAALRAGFAAYIAHLRFLGRRCCKTLLPLSLNGNRLSQHENRAASSNGTKSCAKVGVRCEVFPVFLPGPPSRWSRRTGHACRLPYRRPSAPLWPL